MCFKRKGKHSIQNKVTLGEDHFDVVDTYKYLGHHIQNTLEDIRDVEIRLKSFYGKINWVFRNFNNVSLETIIISF